MTSYEELVLNDKKYNRIWVHRVDAPDMNDMDTAGLASLNHEGVMIWQGAGDGSDDRTISPEEFNRDFKIIKMENEPE